MIPPSSTGCRLGSLLLVGLLLAGCATLVGGGSPETVVIGVDLALTGRGSGRDGVYHQALQLRAEQVNQRREASGRRLVELRVLDNGSDRATSQDNLAQLAADPRVSAIITGGCAECVITAAEDINAAGVATIALAAAGAVAEPVGQRRFLFAVGPDAAGGADVMAARLAGRGVQRLALVTGQVRYGREGARELGDAAEALGMRLVVHEVAERGQDAAALAGLAERVARWPVPVDEAVASAAPPVGVDGVDAVVLWAPEPLALELAVALRQAGWDGPLWLEAVAAGDLFAQGQEAAAALSGARLLFSHTLVADDVVASLPHLARRRRWFDSYLSRFGTYHGPASYAADALDLVVAAVDRIGTDRDRVRDTLEATRLPGLTAAVGFSPSNHSGLDPRGLRVLRFAGGRWHASPASPVSPAS